MAFEKLPAWPGWETGVFLVQREVAERLGAAHGSKAFGILSLAVQAFADVETMLHVPPDMAFMPPPPGGALLRDPAETPQRRRRQRGRPAGVF